MLQLQRHILDSFTGAKITFIGFIICHVDGIIWAGLEISESNVISIRKQHLNFGLNLQIFLLTSASSYHKLKIFC